MGVQEIDGAALKRMMVGAANELNNQKQLVDQMNVFPVPDGDTGTNMSLTALAAARQCEGVASNRVDEVAKAIATGSLRGARGNSGVILSQLIRGFSQALAGMETADVATLQTAMELGVQTAYKAVMKPKEGTILTVAKACADAAAAAQQTEVAEVLQDVIEGGNAMLEQTPEMLPVLKQAGVVDAGGKGLMLLFTGAWKALTGKEVPTMQMQETMPEQKKEDFSALKAVASEEIRFGYCTEFFVEQKAITEGTVQEFRGFLNQLGDSIVLVADDEMMKVHVHTNHPGEVLEKALSIGPLNGLKIENMKFQHTSKIDFSKEDIKPPVSKTAEKAVGFAAVSMGDGLSELFRELGVDEIIPGGQSMNPSTEDILQAISHVPAQSVVLLPNNKNIILASQQAAKLSKDKDVYVIHTTSVPEGMAAMVSYDPSLPLEEALSIMEESRAMTTTCAVTFAVRDTVWNGRQIQEGDIIGVQGDEIISVEKDVAECARDVVEQAVNDSSEVITLYYGQDITEEQAEQLAGELSEIFDQCEIEVYAGGQPLYYYIISVE